MKAFVFLYPVQEYFDRDMWALEESDKERLNRCIDLRYRQKNCDIIYYNFNGHSISNIIEVRPTDKIRYVGLTFEEHTTPDTKGNFLYPDLEYMISQLSDTQTLVIGGFHLFDCVDKLAQKAFESGLHILVDEELTDYFLGYSGNDDFKVGIYPGYDHRINIDDAELLRLYVENRRKKPWLWQWE